MHQGLQSGEHFDLVDELDHVVGRAHRDEVHGNPELIHRVVHVLVFNSAGELFLQKRVDTKVVQPGKWDTSVGGHVDAGEDYHSAARRETAEELAIRDVPMERLYTYLHRNEFESEMVTTYLLIWDGTVTPDPDEIAEGRFWTLQEIERTEPTLFTPNLLEELERYRAWRAERR